MPCLIRIHLFCLILMLHIDHSKSCSDREFVDVGKGCKQCPENCLFCDSDEYCLYCKNEYWGARCENKCSNCKAGTSCAKTNGFCPRGCSDGLSGVLCDTQCDEKCLSCNRTNSMHCHTCAHNRFTSSCDKICPSSCSNETCEDDTGVCTFGCKVGFWGTKCERECPVHCVNNVCLRVNGTCINVTLEEGAVPSYVFYVPAIVVVVGLVAISGAGIWRTRQKRHAQNSSRLTQAESKNLLQESYDKKIDTGSEDASSNQLTNLHARDQIAKTSLEKKVKSKVDRVKTSRGKTKSRQQKFKDIAKQLETKVEADIRKEFSGLPSGNSELFCIESQKMINKRKLEEMGICPYEFNKVVVIGHIGEQYYMNASCIKDNRNQYVAFIACIACLHLYIPSNSLEQYWIENDKISQYWKPKQRFLYTKLNNIKLQQYWPNKKETVQYSWLSVTCIGEYIKDTLDHVIRTFEIKGKTTEAIVVKQLQYLGWSEGDAAGNIPDILEFRNFVNRAKQTNTGPIVVHSRKGVGRTGTYIALDLLLQTVDEMDDSVDETDVDIYLCVKHLREQRVNMVSEEQYKFLHHALAYYLQNKAENKRGQHS